MIEHIRNNWKVILIFALAAIIVVLLYKRGKEELAKQQEEKVNNAKGKTENAVIVENTKITEKPAVTVEENIRSFDDVFEDYRAGKISRAEAQKKSGLPNGTFYRKLNKYDNRKTDAV